MKKHMSSLWVFALVLLCSCEASIDFKQPQPSNEKNLGTFPSRFQGTYRSVADNSSLIIDQTSIEKKGIEECHLSRAEVDTSGIYTRKGNELILGEVIYKIIREERDSIIAIRDYSEEIFRISSDEVLRNYLTNLYLNVQRRNDHWQVRKLDLKPDGTLKFGDIFYERDLEILKEVTEVETVKNNFGRIIQYVADPEPDEFRKFVRKNGFQMTEYFKKTK